MGALFIIDLNDSDSNDDGDVSIHLERLSLRSFVRIELVLIFAMRIVS